MNPGLTSQLLHPRWTQDASTFYHFFASHGTDLQPPGVLRHPPTNRKAPAHPQPATLPASPAPSEHWPLARSDAASFGPHPERVTLTVSTGLLGSRGPVSPRPPSIQAQTSHPCSCGYRFPKRLTRSCWMYGIASSPVSTPVKCPVPICKQKHQTTSRRRLKWTLPADVGKLQGRQNSSSHPYQTAPFPLLVCF